MALLNGIELTRLANGMTVATDSMAGVDTASLGVWVGAGTRHETPAINGVAHLLEHMAFKGTEQRSARDIAVEIEAVGGVLNAYTSREHTAYYARILAGDMPLAMDILADILQRSTLEEAELTRERTVVLQEIGQAEDTPDDIVFDYFQETAYPNQALGRPVLGTADTVANMQRDEIRGYLRRHYTGERMILAAAGKVDHDALVAAAERLFAGLPNSNAEPAEAARYVGGDRRESRDLEQVHLVMGFDGIGYRDDDYYAATVYSTLLGGGMSSRLFQEVRERRGLVYSIYTFAAPYSDGGLFGIYAGTGPEQLKDLIPVVCEEIRRTPATLDKAEIDRARAQLKAGILMARESSSSRCEQLAQQLLVYGRPVPTDEIMAKVEAVDAAAIARVARRIATKPLTMTTLGPVDGLEPYAAISARLS
jgi:predicted Zn-dependent peptidase